MLKVKTVLLWITFRVYIFCETLCEQGPYVDVVKILIRNI